MSSPLNVLLVDDDSAVLAGLRNVLRPERARFAIRVADGPVAALAELEREPADVVVSDIRMPSIDGLEFLGSVLDRWPGTVRVLLSGWADPRTLTRAGTVAHRYLLKPCDPDMLRAELASIQATLAGMTDPGLRATLGGLRSLPGSPATLRALRDLPEDAGERSRAIALAVESDVALATRVLQFTSSPSFGSPRPVESVRAAISLISPGLLREIASLLEPFAASTHLPGALDTLEWLEHHARDAARAARALVQDPGAADVAATAALLHDAGRLALLSRMPARYVEVVRAAARTARPLDEVEQEMIGACHARVGAYLLGLWGLPRPIIDAVLRHHDPAVLADGGLPGIVAAANLHAHRAEFAERPAPRAAIPRSIP